MGQPIDPNLTADVAPAADSLDAGLAAAFGPACSSAGASVLQELRHTYGVLRPVLLRDAEGDSAHVVRPLSAEMPALHQTGDRYQLAGEIARGGMGAVLRGRDAVLGRDLAVKVLLDKHAGSPEVARRFIEEAQVGAQLQHPGIVPVYDFGLFGDRPFFSMKLVKGRTLSALLSERTDLAEDRPRFLGIFLQVCQTLAYAHAKGVIHRDLKPANIMVGAFGEVQVMDWGLAKVLPEGGVADEERTLNSNGCRPPGVEPTVIRTARSGSGGSVGSDTEAGSLLGTPAYMPPEQANGDVELLDRRADVFGLGAILCEILTSKPPYVGRSGEEVRRRAANGDQAETLARLDASGADTELLALAKTCLAPEPADRPRDAKEVADAMAGYLDGVQERLRRAEIERAQAVVKAVEERKRRRVQLALAASMVLLLGLGGGGAWWLREQRVGAERGAEVALREVKELRERGRVPEALATAKRAEALAGRAGAETQAKVAEAVADLTMVDTLDKIRQDGGGIDDETERREAQALERAFRDYGIDVTALGDDAVVERIRGRSIRSELVVGLDEWGRALTAGDLRDRVRQLAMAADPDPDGPMNRLRRARAQKDRDAIRRLATDTNLRGLSPTTLTHIANSLNGAGAADEALRVLMAGQETYPGDFWINLILARSLMRQKPPRTDEAIRYFTAALAIRPIATAYLGLGVVFCDHARRYSEAEAAFRRALELQPNNATAHQNLGVALGNQQRLAEAEAAFRKAIELRPDFAHTYRSLGINLGRQNRPAEAEVAYRKAFELKPDVAQAHLNLGRALRDQGRLTESLASYRRALELGSNASDGNSPTPRLVLEAERLVAAESKLDAVVRGDALPADDTERLALSQVCRIKRMYRTAVGLAAEAFAGTPALADDVNRPDHYNSACAAAQAGCGQGIDVAGVDEAALAQLRTQALLWLRADLGAWHKRLEGGKEADRKTVHDKTRHWQQDRDLVGVRDAAALAKLPADEQKAWTQLWADVAALLAQAEAK